MKDLAAAAAQAREHEVAQPRDREHRAGPAPEHERDRGEAAHDLQRDDRAEGGERVQPRQEPHGPEQAEWHWYEFAVRAGNDADPDQHRERGVHEPQPGGRLRPEQERVERVPDPRAERVAARGGLGRRHAPVHVPTTDGPHVV